MDRVEDSRPAPELAIAPCAKHGPYQAYRIPGAVQQLNDCPRCIDELQAKEDERRAAGQRERDKAAMRDKRLRGVVDDAGIPARFAGLNFSDYELYCDAQANAVGFCKAFANTWPAQIRKGGSLVLTGKCGTGKTHLACTVAAAVMQRHLASARFTSVSDMAMAVRSTYSKNSTKTEAQAIHELVNTDLLILDEVGMQSGSDHELQLMFGVINRRYENQAPVILISNLNKRELETFLGNRVMSRMEQVGTVLAFDWDDYRKRGGK